MEHGRSVRDQEHQGRRRRRAERGRLFHHPHVPLERVRDKKTGDYAGSRAYNVRRSRGLVDAIGASFFGAGGTAGHVEPAPSVRQLAELPGARSARRAWPCSASTCSAGRRTSTAASRSTRSALRRPATRREARMPRRSCGTATASMPTGPRSRSASRFRSRRVWASARRRTRTGGRRLPLRGAQGHDRRARLLGATAWRGSGARCNAARPRRRAPMLRGLHGLVEAITDHDGALNTQDAHIGDHRAGGRRGAWQAWAWAAFDDAAAPYRTRRVRCPSSCRSPRGCWLQRFARAPRSPSRSALRRRPTRPRLPLPRRPTARSRSTYDSASPLRRAHVRDRGCADARHARAVGPGRDRRRRRRSDRPRPARTRPPLGARRRADARDRARPGRAPRHGAPGRPERRRRAAPGRS